MQVQKFEEPLAMWIPNIKPIIEGQFSRWCLQFWSSTSTDPLWTESPKYEHEKANAIRQNCKISTSIVLCMCCFFTDWDLNFDTKPTQYFASLNKLSGKISYQRKQHTWICWLQTPRRVLSGSFWVHIWSSAFLHCSKATTAFHGASSCKFGSGSWNINAGKTMHSFNCIRLLINTLTDAYLNKLAICSEIESIYSVTEE